MEKKKPDFVSKMIIRCANEEDLKELSELLGVELSSETTKLWYPSLETATKRAKSAAPRSKDHDPYWWKDEWIGMPDFVQEKERPYSKIDVFFDDAESREEFAVSIGQTLTKKTKSIWHPALRTRAVGQSDNKELTQGKFTVDRKTKRYANNDPERSQHRYPIYVISKGRWRQRATVKALDEINVKDYHVVIEKQEFDDYASVINPERLLVIPQRFFDEYDTCEENEDGSLSKGSGPARNFCWEHSIENGYARHWVLDDNCRHFHRLNRNARIRVTSGANFRCIEDFVDRYENVYIAGMNYFMFCKDTDRYPPFLLNTRVYSFLLIKNDIPYRWRCRYNEDVDLSLRVLKDGHCTVQFNAFLAEKATTQRHRGGNTTAFYKKKGTLEKSQMTERLHPDVAKVVWKFNRWHHQVDYRPFKDNKLIRRRDFDFDSLPEQDNYGFELVQLK